MKPQGRLSSGDRRLAIVEAVKQVFAEKGFDGTTTRELAGAAGVSEALLYKHFPSKESLYAAILDSCARGPGFDEFQRILALEPSTATAVILVHFMVSHYVQGGCGGGGKGAKDRLIVQSLLEDGVFARLCLKKFSDTWLSKFEACLKAAEKAGDVRQTPVRRDLRGWFSQHIAAGLMLHIHPRVPAVNYKADHATLIEQATWFCLLGAGFKEQAIDRYYNPKMLSLLVA